MDYGIYVGQLIGLIIGSVVMWLIMRRRHAWMSSENKRLLNAVNRLIVHEENKEVCQGDQIEPLALRARQEREREILRIMDAMYRDPMYDDDSAVGFFIDDLKTQIGKG